MNKRERLNKILDGFCEAIGVERTDYNKALITRVVVIGNFAGIKSLITDIEEEEREEIAREQVALAQEFINDMCL